MLCQTKSVTLGPNYQFSLKYYTNCYHEQNDKQKNEIYPLHKFQQLKSKWFVDLMSYLWLNLLLLGPNYQFSPNYYTN